MRPDRLELRVRSKSYRAASGAVLDVLHDFPLSVARGEVVAIVGPSGCGKTTVLRILAGLDSDFDGTVCLPSPGRLGVVFQEPRLLPWRTVEQNVRLAAPEAGDDLVRQLFAMLGLAEHVGHFPGELSLGLARRVSLARAFAVQPDVLLLDEPFVSLDATLARELRRELAALVAARPVTTLLVTHDIEEAVELADRLIVLSPRPAKVLCDLELAPQRGTRTAADLAGLVEMVRGRIAAGVTPSPADDAR